MTPPELIVAKMTERLAASGVTLPVESLLAEALAGTARKSESSGVVLSVALSGQLYEAQPTYTFDVRATLTVSIDDDKTGELFRTNYAAMFAAFDFLARADNCTEIAAGDVFQTDGFQLSQIDEPGFSSDDNGGTWATTFAATITGRAT